MKICVIPARGGSKRIPKKNIRVFCGKPMISWSIEAAISSDIFDKVLVSTDDKEISQVARNYGAEVPFLRPKELADDYTGTIPVIKHSIEWVNNNISNVEYACCIYPTAPFIENDYLVKGLENLINLNADYSFSVTTFPYPIQRALKIIDSNQIRMFQPENFNKRTQDFCEAYHDAGQFYWGKATSWINKKKLFEGNSIPVIIPRYKVQDIDNEEDWKRAENMFKNLKNN